MAFPSVRGIRNAGAADSGTRLSVQLRDVPKGVQIWVPGVLMLRSKLSGLPTGRAVLTANNGAFSPTPTNAAGFAQIGGLATYEVLYADPFDSELVDVPVSVVYEAGSPEAGILSTVTAGLATRDTTRSQSFNAFAIESCDCHLLFPVVTNRNGYDTGIAIGNTGPDEGKVTLHYFCGTEECASPLNQTTSTVIEAGKQLTFTLSGGGGTGVEPVPGFQGYIVARAQFRYCHGYAFLSALNSIATGNGASSGYVALILDRPSFRPDVALSERLGH